MSTKTATPDPYDDPSGYLRARGWRPLGNPAHQSCRWLDPTKPLKDEYAEAPVMTTKVKDGKEVVGPMMIPDGLGAMVPCRQRVYRAAGQPVELVDALQAQLERDAREEAEQPLFAMGK